jgi:hypothetical protein
MIFDGLRPVKKAPQAYLSCISCRSCLKKWLKTDIIHTFAAGNQNPADPVNPVKKISLWKQNSVGFSNISGLAP